MVCIFCANITLVTFRFQFWYKKEKLPKSEQNSLIIFRVILKGQKNHILESPDKGYFQIFNSRIFTSKIKLTINCSKFYFKSKTTFNSFFYCNVKCATLYLGGDRPAKTIFRPLTAAPLTMSLTINNLFRRR